MSVIKFLKEFVANLVDRLLNISVFLVSILLLCLPVVIYIVLVLCNVVNINLLVSIIVIIVTILWFSASIDTLEDYIGIKKKDNFLNKQINRDALTGLNNRNAYETKINKLSIDKDDNTVGVIFCNLNKLKETNKDKGHDAGDQLIIKLSDILKSCFNKYDIYRTSGDEFVVIIDSITGQELESQYHQLAESTIKEDYIASCGRSYGLAADVINLLKKAEKNMYIDKRIYYEKMGIDRRRS